MPNNAAMRTFRALDKHNISNIYDYFQCLNDFLNRTIATCEHPSPPYFKLVIVEKAIKRVKAKLNLLNSDSGRLIIIGNGGSAAIASHMLVDFFNVGGLHSLDLFGSPLLTCMSNDYGYDNVFAEPLKKQATPSDVLFAISSSGMSTNILTACEIANAKNCFVVTFSGFSANNHLRQMGNINFYIPSRHYGFVELAHGAILHYILDSFVVERVRRDSVPLY